MIEYKFTRQLNESPKSVVVLRINAMSIGLAKRACEEMVYALRVIKKHGAVDGNPPEAWAMEACSASGRQKNRVYVRYSANSQMNVNVGGKVFA